MEIKRIQLRGISRSPSDRLTEDGGCAESLNVRMDDNEIAPAIEPKEINIGIPEGTIHDRFFVHKTQSAEVYIAIDSDRIGYYHNNKYDAIITLLDEQVRDVTSVGNTLIFATDKGMKFVLFKEGKYQYLGDKIPKPEVQFQCVETGDISHTGAVAIYSNASGATPNKIDLFDVATWNQTIDELAAGKSTTETKRMTAIQSSLWDSINRKADALRRDGFFSFPRMIRYAVKLYDGSYIYQSVPILLGAGHERFAKFTGYYNYDEDSSSTYYTEESYIEATFNSYKASLFAIWEGTEPWRDVVQSLDIFISPEIYFPAMHANFSKITKTKDEFGTTGDPNTEGYGYTHREFAIDFVNGNTTDYLALEQELLNVTNFYKIGSFTISQMSRANGWDIGREIRNITQDDLVLEERLPDYQQSDSDIAPARLFSFNNRVFAVGGERSLSEGYDGQQSTNILASDYGTKNRAYTYSYFIMGNDATLRKVVNPKSFFSYQSNGKYSQSYGFLCHPDPRCKQVKVRDADSKNVYYVDMKPHPALNCSYAYWGLEKTIEDLNYTPAVSDQDFNSGQNKWEKDDLRLYASAVNNPFNYPLSGNQTMQGYVIGMAMAAAPMSQGQFGQYPIYAFTDEGIFAMETNGVGDVMSIKPVSREVCINPDSITPLDQSVLFVSDKGLMNITGSQVVSLSPNMNGKHYKIDDTAKSLIKEQVGFDKLTPPLINDLPFMTFIKGAQLGYDYAGERIICVHPDVGYQYVFDLRAKTWHKIYLGLDDRMKSVVNSYPSCEIAGVEDGTSKIYNFSTILGSSSSQEPLKVIIITRPFDLDEPDILKTITDLKVRGSFKKGAIKFILQGSQDGVNYYTLSTLRGKAWKRFRVTILADLDLYERISWIDIAYDRKLTNRLR